MVAEVCGIEDMDSDYPTKVVESIGRALVPSHVRPPPCRPERSRRISAKRCFFL
jgi:hypothetical protein